MQRPLGDFLRALRSVDIRISPAEAIDAHRAVAEVGFADRELLRDALCVALAKSALEVSRFEVCFDTFFLRERPLADLSIDENGADLAVAMEAAARRIGVGEIRLMSQRNLLVRRLLDDMGLRDLEARINALRGAGGAGDGTMADGLAGRRAALFAEAGRFVDRQARLHAGETGRRLRETFLAQEKLTAIDPEDFRAMEILVRRMAKRLASRYARKRRRARAGRLDVRRTIARSMGHGGIPFEIVWKTKVVHKPKVVVICDVSRSVAAAAQFLLLFLYSLNEVVERLDAFAFSDRLVCVNDFLAEETVDDAIALILGRIGFRPTDYGRALADFFEIHGGKLDRRTTVIVLGDGRSNYAEPRLDLMRRIAERSRAVIWLNPEPQSYWGQGDSRMDAYRRFCHVAKTCNTLGQLERIVEDVLRTYLPR